MKEQPGYYSILPAVVRYSKAISDFEKILFSEITALSNKRGYCSASNQHFAELYGKKSENISRHISKLESLGFLHRIIIKDETGQVVQRKLIPSDQIVLIEINEGTVISDNTPLVKNVNRGTVISDKYNNTSINTTREKPVFNENGVPSFSTEKPKRKKEDYSELIAQVVDYLNAATGRKFGYTTKTTQRSIIARAKEGYTFEDFAAVIDCKTAEWLHNSDLSRHLNPETLFGNKMEKYLVCARAEKTSRANTDTALNDMQLDQDTATKYAAYITHAQAQYPALWSSAVRVLSHSEFQDYLQNKSIPAVQYGLTPKEKRNLLLKVHEQLNASADARKKYSRTFDAYLTAARQALRQENVKI